MTEFVVHSEENAVFYRPHMKDGESNVFTYVCLFTGRGVSCPLSWQGVSVQGGLCPGGSLSRGASVQGGLCPWGRVSVRGDLCHRHLWHMAECILLECIRFSKGYKSFLWGPLFWTSGEVSSGFQSQSEKPYLHLAEAYMLHVPWNSPLLQHLPTSWQPAWLLSQFLPHTCDPTLAGLKQEASYSIGKCSTDWAMSARLLECILVFY